MNVTVARIGRAHGLKGEVTLEIRTDIPEQRLVPGATFATADGTLTLTRVRQQSGRWVAAFAQLTDRSAAEAVRGTELVIDGSESDEDDAWYIHELVGLRVQRPDGSPVGTVAEVLDLPAQDVLVVREPSGHRAMIPFTQAFVPHVDIAGGRVIVTPPYGLLDGEEPA